jgi:tripartite-type tricarboxylate transporter receptor subunit TctC
MKKLIMFSVLIFTLVLGGCSAKSTNGSSAKQEFPTKTIELIVPYAPGGGTDTAARIMAENVKKHLPKGQSVVVVNKPGGSSTIGISEILKSKPDGYKLGVVTTTGTSIQPHFGKTNYSHDSFQPIIRFVSAQQLLVVKKDAPWKTFDEWLEYAKKNPNAFTYGSANAGGTAHVAIEALSAAAGVKTKNVPFDGAAPAVTALLGGHTQGAAVQIQEAKSQIDAGEIRPLVNVGSKTVEEYKDIPLAKDKWSDVSFDVYTGLIAPKDLPEDILTILHDAFKKTMEDPAVVEKFKELDLEMSYAGPEDFQKDITDNFNSSGKVLKNIGLVK